GPSVRLCPLRDLRVDQRRAPGDPERAELRPGASISAVPARRRSRHGNLSGRGGLPVRSSDPSLFLSMIRLRALLLLLCVSCAGSASSPPDGEAVKALLEQAAAGPEEGLRGRLE